MNNNLFRLVFSKKLGMLVAVAETTSSQGKAAAGERTGAAGLVAHLRPMAAATLAATGALLGLSLVQLAFAQNLPSGGVVQAGQANITSPSSTSLVVQQQSQRAVIDWQNFSVGKGYKVQFVQPGTSSIVMNRVVGSEQSQIFGQLTANGGVFLTNTNGILFGAGSQIDVGHFVGSTLGMGTADFMAGKSTFSGNSSASVINHGSISGTSVALVAAQVVNSGSISTPGGTTALAAGQSVDLDFNGDKLLAVRVNVGSEGGSIKHSGIISADGAGSVIMTAAAKDALLNTAINVTGRISAKGISTKGGEVYLDSGAGGTTELKGAGIDALSAQSGGGKVTILGNRVGLLGATDIDASGASGGGQVLVGGNWQGKGTERNALVSFADTQVTIQANANSVGDGGKVVVWADGATIYKGNISAKGGSVSGNGGNVEVSGKQYLSYEGKVDASAANGNLGTLLLDPDSITINSSTPNLDGSKSGTSDLGDDISKITYTNIAASDFGTANSVITNTALVTQLNSASVSLAANNTITVNADVNAAANGKSLSLKAPTINLNADISTKNRDIDFDGAVTLGGVGLRTLNAGTANITVIGAITGAGHDLTTTAGGTRLYGAASGLGALTATNLETRAVTATSVTATGNTKIGGDITTSAGQTYGNVTLVNHSTLKDTNNTALTLGDITGASLRLGLSTTGGTTAGVVNVMGLRTNGALAATSVTTGVNYAFLGGNVTTTGDQNYTLTALTAGVTIATGTGNGSMGTIDGGAANNLTFTGKGNFTIGASSDLGAVTATNLTTTGSLAAASVNVTGAATLGGNVTTTDKAGQTYGGGITLTANTALNAGAANALTLNGITGAGKNLTLTGLASTSGTASDIGALRANQTLTTTGNVGAASVNTTGAATLGGNVTTTGSAGQSYGGGITLVVDTALDAGAANALTLNGITGAGKNLTLTGLASTSGTVSDIGALLANQTLTTRGLVGAASVNVTGATTLGGNVTTTAGQTYAGITLSSDAVLTDTGKAALSLGAVTGAGKNLNLTTTSGTTALAMAGIKDLSTNGALNATSVNTTGAATLGGNVTTTGKQNYGGSTALTGDITLTSTASGDITVKGATGAKTLTINTAGLTSLDGNFSNTSVTTDAPGSAFLNVGSSSAVFTVGETSLCGTLSTNVSTGVWTDLTLCGNTVLAYGAGTTNITNLTGAGFNLDMQGAGTHTIGSTVSSVGALTSTNLTTTGNLGATSVNTTGAATLGGNVTTTGSAGQSYGGGITLAVNTALDAGAANALTLNGITGAGKNLTLTGLASTSGTASDIGALLANQTLTTTGNVGAASVNVTGATTLGGNVTTTGTQNYGANMALTSNAILTSTGAGNISVKGATGAQTLVINTAGITALEGNFNNTSVTTDAPGSVSLNVVGGSATITNNEASVCGNSTTSGTMNFGSAVVLCGDTILTATSVNFASTVDSDATARSLTVNASGATVFGGLVGNTALLTSLTTDAAGTSSSVGVKTSGATSLNDDTTVSGTYTNTGFTAAKTTVLAGDTIVNAATSAVTFTGAVNATALGKQSLTVNTAGATTFSGLVGATTALSSLMTDANTAGTSSSVGVTTSGATTFGDNTSVTGTYSNAGLTASGTTTLTGNTVVNAGTGNVAFAGTVNSDATARTLSVNSTGLTSFAQEVGNINPLASLTTNAGGTASLGGNVSTTGAVAIGEAVTIANAVAINAVGITLGGPVSAQTVTLNAGAGNVLATDTANDFTGAVSSTGANISLKDANALTLAATTATGNLTLESTGALAINGDTSVTGNMLATTNGTGAITQTNKLVVTGTTGLTATARDITLANAANDFTGAVSSTGANVDLKDANALLLGTTAATGNLTIGATGISFGASTVGGKLDVVATGAVTQTGAIVVVGTTVLTTGVANIELSNAANSFGGAVAMALGSGSAKLTSSKAIDLGTSDYGTAAVALTALGSSGTGSVMTGGMAADSGTLTASSKASFSQSGVLKSAVGGSLVLASPAEADVLLNSKTNDLKGTVATTAGLTNPLRNFQLVSNQAVIGAGGITARSVVFVADSVTTPRAADGSIRLIQRGDNSVVLTFRGLTGIGQYGFAGVGNGIYVDTNDYVAVMPNNVVTPQSVVYLEGNRTFKPAYEFASDTTYRVVVYNGEAADSPQIRGALSSAIAPLRDTIKEQLSAGFSKENLRKQLSEGVVLQTGVARPGIDIIGNALEATNCDSDATGLACVGSSGGE